MVRKYYRIVLVFLTNILFKLLARELNYDRDIEVTNYDGDYLKPLRVEAKTVRYNININGWNRVSFSAEQPNNITEFGDRLQEIGRLLSTKTLKQRF